MQDEALHSTRRYLDLVLGSLGLYLEALNTSHLDIALYSWLCRTAVELLLSKYWNRSIPVLYWQFWVM